MFRMMVLNWLFSKETNMTGLALQSETQVDPFDTSDD